MYPYTLNTSIDGLPCAAPSHLRKKYQTQFPPPQTQQQIVRSGHSLFREIWGFCLPFFLGGWRWQCIHYTRSGVRCGLLQLSEVDISFLSFFVLFLFYFFFDEKEPFSSYQRWPFLLNDVSRPIYACAPNLKWNCQISIWICSCCCCSCAKAEFSPFVQLAFFFECQDDFYTLLEV